MFASILDVIVASAEGSFLQVTVFVGLALLVFGYLNYLTQGRFVGMIQGHKNLQPVFGAILGLTPGCGGAIFVMPLYINGTVGFGTVIAALIATMGDSAFVLVAALPFHFLVVSGISFVVAIAGGYLVDWLRLAEHLKLGIHAPVRTEPVSVHESSADHTVQGLVCDTLTGCHQHHLTHIGHEEGDAVDIAMHHDHPTLMTPESLLTRLATGGSYLYWLLLAVGIVFGVMLLMQYKPAGTPLAGIMTTFGVIGTLLSVMLVAAEKKIIRDDTFEESELKLMSMKQTLIHNAHETAFAGTWVFLAYLVYEGAVLWAGGGDYGAGELTMQQFMTAAGLMSVVIGALAGIIPGCGIQILYISLFIKGWFPFAALVANAISQDGDALFPLIAMDRKSSFWATIITTVPALVVGLAIYWFERGTNLLSDLEVAWRMLAGLIG